MGEVSYDSDNSDEFGKPAGGLTSTDFTGKLIEWGLVSSRQQAEYVMICIAVAVVIVAILVYYA